MIPIPSCRLLLAPTSGRVRPAAPPDAPVASGQVVAFLETDAQELELTAPARGTFGGYLVGSRQAVHKGTPIAWVAS